MNRLEIANDQSIWVKEWLYEATDAFLSILGFNRVLVQDSEEYGLCDNDKEEHAGDLSCTFDDLEELTDKWLEEFEYLQEAEELYIE